MHISRYFYGPRCDTLLKAPFPLRKKNRLFSSTKFSQGTEPLPDISPDEV